MDGVQSREAEVSVDRKRPKTEPGGAAGLNRGWGASREQGNRKGQRPGAADGSGSRRRGEQVAVPRWWELRSHSGPGDVEICNSLATFWRGGVDERWARAPRRKGKRVKWGWRV